MVFSRSTLKWCGDIKWVPNELFLTHRTCSLEEKIIAYKILIVMSNTFVMEISCIYVHTLNNWNWTNIFFFSAPERIKLAVGEEIELKVSVSNGTEYFYVSRKALSLFEMLRSFLIAHPWPKGKLRFKFHENPFGGSGDTAMSEWYLAYIYIRYR